MTQRWLESPLVTIMRFEGGKVDHEHLSTGTGHRE